MGNQQAILSDVDIEDLKETTPFDENDLKRLEKRYQTLDKSPEATDGITYDQMLLLPEFSGNELVPQVIAANLDSRSGRVYAKQFVQIFGILSRKANPVEKKEFLYEIFNVYGTDGMTHDELFRVFKMLFSKTMTDDHILALTFRALNHPFLKTKGEISREEFMKMIPDHEIVNRLSVDF